MLLQVMADARDVAGTFDLVRQTNTGDFAQSGVRLFGRRGFDAQADTALLRALLQNRGGRLGDDFLPSLTDQLIDRGHGSTSLGNISRALFQAGYR